MDCGPQGPLGLGSRTWGSRDTECEVALILEASQLKKLVDLEVWGGHGKDGEPKSGVLSDLRPYSVSHHPLQAPRF